MHGQVRMARFLHVLSAERKYTRQMEDVIESGKSRREAIPAVLRITHWQPAGRPYGIGPGLLDDRDTCVTIRYVYCPGNLRQDVSPPATEGSAQTNGAHPQGREKGERQKEKKIRTTDQINSRKATKTTATIPKKNVETMKKHLSRDALPVIDDASGSDVAERERHPVRGGG